MGSTNLAPTRATPLVTSHLGNPPPAPDRSARRRRDAATVAGPRRDLAGPLATGAMVLALLVLVALPAISATAVVHVLGGAAALVAIAALASLTHLVVTDVRDALRARRRRTPGGPPGGRRSGSPGTRATVLPRADLTAWRRSLLGPVATLGLAALLLALVVRSPRSVPLLVGVGVSGLLALRMLVMPSRRAR